MFGFGNRNGNGYGNGNDFLRAEMYDGLNSQSVNAQLGNIHTAMNDGFSCNQMNLANNFASLNLGLNNGFNGIANGLANLGFQMSSCCCDLKQSIQMQGDLTRSLINENTMQNLRDKLAEKDRELLGQKFLNSQRQQTDAIERFVYGTARTVSPIATTTA